MSVTLDLTTAQKPIFRKLMKAANIKFKFEESSVELTDESYTVISDAVADAWFKATMSEDKDEKYLQQINHRLSNLEHFFAKPTDTTETKEGNDNA